jgi:hypothetical protein
MRKIGGMLDFIQAIGGTEMTRRVLPACGFTERAHAWRGARPLRPVRQILRHQSRNWKLAPRLVRNWTWSRAPKSVLAPEWSVETIHPEALSEYARATRRPPSLFSARTPEFFEFYLRCPVGRVTLHQVRKGGAPQGHFLLLTLRGQARLAGMWLCEATPENWYATFLLAQRAAISFTDVDELVAAGTRGVSEEAAIAAGLRITGDVPVFLLGSSRRLSLPPDYQFQLCDDDEAFLDSGGPDYLT